MKKFTLAIALALGISGGAQAAPLEIIEASSLAAPTQQLTATSALPRLSVADLSVVQTASVVAPATNMSELPEPEVFLMMFLGLCLIGYRASRHSDEKFE